MVATSELSIGDAVRILRSTMLGMDRKRFARAVKVATSVLATLEDDADANPRLQTLMKVLAPFGGRVGILFPRNDEPSPPTDGQKMRRDELRAALAMSKRPRRRANSLKDI